MKPQFGRGAVSDGRDTNSLQGPTRILTSKAKILIIYYSRSGNTEAQAQIAQQTLAADEYELVVKYPYPANYSTTVQRATAEREHQEWPELIEDDFPNINQYGLILLGHPIWAMTIANPMRRFLEEKGQLFDGKTVASFSTNAGYGSGETQTVIRELIPKTTRLAVNYTIEDRESSRTRNRFEKWLKQFM